MTWAARYSRTEQPELTIYRDGEPFDWLSTSDAREALRWDHYPKGHGRLDYISALDAAWHDEQVRADIAARVPVRECIETDACRNHAVDGERCWSHGGSDPL